MYKQTLPLLIYICCILFCIAPYAYTYSYQNKLTIQIQNISLKDAITLIANLLPENIMISESIHGTTSLYFKNANPHTVLNLLLRTHRLTKIKQNDIVFIAPIEEVLKVQQKEMELFQMRQKSAPLVTFMQQIQYGSAMNIATIIKDDHASFVSERGSIKIDKRTNTIAIRDTEMHVALIRNIIHRLDVPVKQILIEARIASVDHDCERDLGVRFDVISSNPNPNHEHGHGRKSLELVQQHGQTGHYSVAVAHLPDGSLLDVKLAALEKAGHAELISCPSLSTTNQESASIEAGEEVPYQEVSESGGTAVTFKKAVLGLKVTPEVLPGNKVLLKLQINQDRPSNKLVQGVPTINTRKIITNVLAVAGQTIVLGGIFETNQEKGVSKIPFLSQIPLIGWLFQETSSKGNRRELLIFVTPKFVS